MFAFNPSLIREIKENLATKVMYIQRMTKANHTLFQYQTKTKIMFNSLYKINLQSFN